MKALCWEGTNKLRVEQVPDPQIRNSGDVIVKVRASAACGSDLHLLGGYIPAMEAGDVLGHEFLGEIVEVGSGVRTRKVGERVVVCSFAGCGSCWYCTHDLWSLCDNANTNSGITQALWGSDVGACFGCVPGQGGVEFVPHDHRDDRRLGLPGCLLVKVEGEGCPTCLIAHRGYEAFGQGP